MSTGQHEFEHRAMRRKTVRLLIRPRPLGTYTTQPYLTAFHQRRTLGTPFMRQIWTFERVNVQFIVLEHNNASGTHGLSLLWCL